MNVTGIITQIEELDKRRCKVYIDQEYAFTIYKGELTEYKIRVNNPIDDKIYHMIKTEVLPKRAKKRCLNLLQKRPYTEYKLREKLVEGYYTEDIVDEAIAYVKSFHYIDDYEYACQYIFYHKESESRRKMEEKLMLKGIDRDTLQKAFNDSYTEDEQFQIELEQAKKLLQKKKYEPDNADWKERQKIYSFLVRKGISSAAIKKAMIYTICMFFVLT